jgi:hypothetical protein
MPTTSFLAIAQAVAIRAVLLLFLGTGPPGVAEKDSDPDAAVAKPSADYRTPQKTLQTYLRAVKANDAAAAKQCWVISDKNKSDVLDILVGDVITAHRLNEVVRSKFPAQGRELLGKDQVTRDSCTDEAIDRTLERLKDAEVEVRGDTAKLWVRWQDNDGREEQPVFRYSGSIPIARFRLVNGAWKIDANKEIGFQRPADFFEPAGWFYFYPGWVAIEKQILADVENGKVQTAEQTAKAHETRRQAFLAEVEAERKRRHLDPDKACFFAAWRITQRMTRVFSAGAYVDTGGNFSLWSSRLMEAEKALSRGEAERIAVAEAHLDRMRDARKAVREHVAFGHLGMGHYLAADFYAAEAKAQVAEAKTGPAAKSKPAPAAPTRLAAARLKYENYWQEYRSQADETRRQLPLDTALAWSRRWLDAEMVLGTDSEQRAAAKGYLARAKELEKLAKAWLDAGRLGNTDYSAVIFYRADAQFLFERLKAEGRLDPRPSFEAARVRREAAQAVYEGYWKETRAGRGSVEKVYEWSCHWRDAARTTQTSPAERVALAEAHLSRMRELQKPIKERYSEGRIPAWELWATEFYIAEAELLLSAAKAK